MTWTNVNGETSADRPKRVRLPDHTTRTSEAVTDEILAEAGWSWVEPVTEQVSVEEMTGVTGASVTGASFSTSASL